MRRLSAAFFFDWRTSQDRGVGAPRLIWRPARGVHNINKNRQQTPGSRVSSAHESKKIHNMNIVCELLDASTSGFTSESINS